MSANMKFTIGHAALTAVAVAMTVLEIVIGGSVWELGLCIASSLLCATFLIRSIGFVREDRRRHAEMITYLNIMRSWREGK